MDQLDKLEYLELSNNSGLGAVSAIDAVNHPNLKALGLANTGLSGVYNVPTIPSLSDYDLDALGTLIKVPGLNVADNSLTGIAFAPEHANYNLGGQELPGLNLAGNLFSILDLNFRNSIDAMPNLKSLDLSSNIFLTLTSILWLNSGADCLSYVVPCTITH